MNELGIVEPDGRTLTQAALNALALNNATAQWEGSGYDSDPCFRIFVRCDCVLVVAPTIKLKDFVKFLEEWQRHG